MGCGVQTKDLLLKYQKGCIRGCEDFEYLGVKIVKEDRRENYNKNKINEDRTIIRIRNAVLWNK
jgi:hypothetical protein